MGALVGSSGFLAALLTASVASFLAVIVTRRRTRSIALGSATVVGVLVGLGEENVLNATLPIGLLLIAVGALVSEERSVAARAAAIAPGGALLVTLAAEGTAGWARALVFVTIVVAGPAAVAFDRRFPSLTVALLTLSALGAYGAVPDTEQARALVGALVPVALLALVRRPTPEASTPSLGVALVAWVALVGGGGRPGSVVGAIGCLGVLALGSLTRSSSPVLVVAVHLPVVAVASRIAGLRQSAWTAAAIVVPVIITAAALLAVAGRSRVRNFP